MNIAAFIDHTLLKADATADQIRQLCAEARAHEFAAVCVNPCRVALSAKELRGSGVEVCTVAGFPLGATRSEQKAVEALRAVEDGAREVDMVLNVGALRDGDADAVRRDIEAVVIACSGGGGLSSRSSSRPPCSPTTRSAPPVSSPIAQGPNSSRPPPASVRAAPPLTMWPSWRRQ